MEIIDKIKKARKQKGYSQLDMAKYLGITQSSYSDIEREKVTLTVPTLEKICKKLDLDFSLKGHNEAVVIIDQHAPITRGELDESLEKMENSILNKLANFFAKK